MTTTTQLTLPPVAKSFYTLCKKCEGDRYHRVLAHTSETSAKIECEVCKSRKTYTLPKPGSKPAAKRVSTGGSSSRSTGTAKSHTGQYEIYNQNKMGDDGTAYSTKSKFNEKQKINHPKFGIGFVTKVYNDKVDVIFVDEVRTLMHART